MAPKKTANVSPAYARVIEEFKADRKHPAKTMGERYAAWDRWADSVNDDGETLPAPIRAWQRRVNDMRHLDPGSVDPRAIKPEDMSFELGPPMTEEQFKTYKATRGDDVTIVGKTTMRQP